jgi:hypothetical protein
MKNAMGLILIFITYVFVGYTQAFDSVKRCQIIYCLKNYNIPAKLIRLIAATLQNTKAKVKINGELSEGFQISCGVKQGDSLSASLFILVIDEILKSLDVRGNISTRLKQCCAFADDILIIARTK